MKNETVKATIAIKAETLEQLTNALARANDEFGGQLVRDASVSCSIKLEANDLDDLREAISDVLAAVAQSDGVNANVNVPDVVWSGPRRAAGPTPMEKAIEEAVTLSHNGRSVTLNAQTKRNAAEMLAKSWTTADDDRLFDE